MTDDQLTDLATLYLAGKEDGGTLDLLPMLRAVVAAEGERCTKKAANIAIACTVMFASQEQQGVCMYIADQLNRAPL